LVTWFYGGWVIDLDILKFNSKILLTKYIFSILIILIILEIYSEEIILSLNLLDYFINLYNFFIVNDYFLLENYSSQLFLTQIAPILPLQYLRDDKGSFTGKTANT
jgi:hypothetical protein